METHLEIDVTETMSIVSSIAEGEENPARNWPKWLKWEEGPAYVQYIRKILIQSDMIS